MADSQVELRNGTAVVRIAGVAQIDVAAQLHRTFSEASDSRMPIVLDIAAITDCDTSFVQLISSLCHTLMSGGRTLEFTNHTLPEAVAATAATIGFGCRTACSRHHGASCLFEKVGSRAQSGLEFCP